MHNKEGKVEVTVVCLAYNHEKYIRHTLEGFANQETKFKYEVIVHEDASTDGTRRIIEEYVKRYPDIFVPIYQDENQYSKGNKIISKIVNQKARGKYIAYCEGDDYWCDNRKLQMQYDAMEKHQECSICVHDVGCINEDGSENSRRFPEKKYGFFKEEVVEKNKICKAFWKIGSYPFHTSSYFIRKEIQDESIKLNSEDGWVKYSNGDVTLLRISLYRGEFYYINRMMSKRRLDVPGSYNDRLKKSTDSLKYTIWRDGIKSLQMYDEYTEKKFHEYIESRVINSIIVRLKVDLDNPIDVLRECGISHKDVIQKADFYNKIFYIMLLCVPSSVHIIRKLWKIWEKITYSKR